MSVVYLVTNRINGKQYVGKTVYTLRSRRFQHEHTALRMPSLFFHRALRKYGFKSFTWEVLFCGGKNLLLDRWEKYYIKLLETKVPNGYNLTDGGEGICGMVFSEESRAKMSDAKRGIKHSLKTRIKMSAAHKGRKYSVEHCNNISASQKGRKHTPEAKAKISAALKGRIGRLHTPEECAKMSAMLQGRKITPEWRTKISVACMGKRPSTEARAKMSASQKGRKHSAETRAKMCVSQKIRYLNTKV